MIKALTKQDRSFRVEDGIHYFTEPEENHWDALYAKGIRGNLQKNDQHLVDFIKMALEDRQACRTYFASIPIVEKAPSRANMIEVGSGTGSFSLILKKLGLVRDVVLVEKSRHVLMRSQALFEALGEEAVFVYADAADLPFVDNAFDISLSGGLIEHFVGDTQTAIIREQYRCARYPIYQFPAQSPMYWVQRGLISMLNGFKWPFGYECPVGKKTFFSHLPSTVSSDFWYHDFLTAFCFRYSTKLNFLPKLRSKTFFNRMFLTDYVFGIRKEEG